MVFNMVCPSIQIDISAIFIHRAVAIIHLFQWDMTLEFHSIGLHPIESIAGNQISGHGAKPIAFRTGEVSMTRHVAVALVLAVSALAGCSTTEGQQSTDAFVAREMTRRGVTVDHNKTEPAPAGVTTAPAS